jgi:hypothetical protein
MIKKLLCFVIICFTLQLPVFAHEATIPGSGDHKYKAVMLTPEICAAANPSLSDLLITGSNGQALPYFIREWAQSTASHAQSYPMSLINSYEKDGEFTFDYKLTSIPNHDIIATSIAVNTDHSGFAKTIELYGGYDNIHWEKVMDGSLYSIDGKSNLELPFPQPQKYTHYRFILSNNLEKIEFSSVQLQYTAQTVEQNYFTETANPVFTVETKDKSTYVQFSGFKNLRIMDISLRTDSIFKRMVSLNELGVRKELYYLAFSGTTYSDLTLPVNMISKSDELTIVIANGDDREIDIKGVSVTYCLPEIIFEGDGSAQYALTFSGDTSKTAPVYDVVAYKDDIIASGEYDTLTIKSVTFDEPTQEPEMKDYTMIFNVVIIAIALLLGFVVFLRLKKK